MSARMTPSDQAALRREWELAAIQKMFEVLERELGKPGPVIDVVRTISVMTTSLIEARTP